MKDYFYSEQCTFWNTPSKKLLVSILFDSADIKYDQALNISLEVISVEDEVLFSGTVEGIFKDGISGRPSQRDIPPQLYLAFDEDVGISKNNIQGLRFRVSSISNNYSPVDFKKFHVNYGL